MDQRAFQRHGERLLSIPDDAFGPFFHRVADTVRQHARHWLLFAEIDPFGSLAGRPFPSVMPTNWVNASHWYDLTLLLAKRFNAGSHVDLLSGEVASDADAVRKRYVVQLTRAMQHANAAPGGVPTLIGEFGIPFDLHDAQAYADWAGGGLDSGGRAVAGFCRPYARAVQGRLHALHFEPDAGRLNLSYGADDKLDGPTEIYVPRLHFPLGYRVDVAGSQVRQIVDRPGQRLLLWAAEPGPVRVSLTRLSESEA